jgi:hypothetical protein
MKKYSIEMEGAATPLGVVEGLSVPVSKKDQFNYERRENIMLKRSELENYCFGLFWRCGCDGAHPSIWETPDIFMISILMEGFALSKPVPELQTRQDDRSAQS